MAKKPEGGDKYRDAGTGQYITKKEADRDPGGTVRERDRPRGAPPGKPAPKK